MKRKLILVALALALTLGLGNAMLCQWVRSRSAATTRHGRKVRMGPAQ